MFGTELAVGQSFACAGMKLAVFTWHGCRLQVAGPCAVAYVWKSTPMPTYLNTHTSLDSRRQNAAIHGSPGPRVRGEGGRKEGRGKEEGRKGRK